MKNLGDAREENSVKFVVIDRQVQPSFFVDVDRRILATSRACISLIITFSIDERTGAPLCDIIFTEKIGLRLILIVLLLANPIKAVLKFQKRSRWAPQHPLELFNRSKCRPV